MGADSVVRAYLTQVVGHVPPAYEEVIAEFAAAANGSRAVSPGGASTHEVARSVALDALDSDLHKFGYRIARAAAGHIQCATLARRLRDRAGGRMAGRELERFYRHLERCEECGRVTARFDAAEWYLRVELGPNLDRAAPALATPPEEPQATRRAVPTPPRARNTVLVVALILVVGGGGAYLLRPGASSPTKPAPTRQAPAITGTALSPQRPAAVVHLTETPFVLAGARFAVFANPNQAWTAFTRRVSPGAGNRWELVTVRVRNLTRTGFDPRVLHYRLIAKGSVNYFQNLRYGTGPRIGRDPEPLGPQALVQAKLAFQVPLTASRLRLAFDPTGQHDRVIVPLG